MKARFIALIALMPLAGCVQSGSAMKLYPVDGPIAAANPTLVVDLNANVTDETSGKLSFKLPSRVKCTGTWTTVAPREVERTKGLSLTIRGPNGKLDRTVTNVAGVNQGEIYAVCSDGNRLQGTFVVGSGTTSGTGRVSDIQGNTYKLLF